MTTIEQTTQQDDVISETVNFETGEGITWYWIGDEKWNYPANFWYERENRDCEWRVTVTELFEDNNSVFEAGDILEISGFVGDIKPGDLIIEIYRSGSAIRRVKDLQYQEGPNRGPILCKTDFTDPRPDEFIGPWEIAGKVITLIRNLDIQGGAQ